MLQHAPSRAYKQQILQRPQSYSANSKATLVQQFLLRQPQSCPLMPLMHQWLPVPGQHCTIPNQQSCSSPLRPQQPVAAHFKQPSPTQQQHSAHKAISTK
jgi:hypothetical protein